MNTREIENKVAVKEGLAAKYARLAKVAKSEAKRSHFLFKSARYRRQAENLRKLVAK